MSLPLIRVTQCYTVMNIIWTCYLSISLLLYPSYAILHGHEHYLDSLVLIYSLNDNIINLVFVEFCIVSFITIYNDNIIN